MKHYLIGLIGTVLLCSSAYSAETAGESETVLDNVRLIHSSYISTNEVNRLGKSQAKDGSDVEALHDFLMGYKFKDSGIATDAVVRYKNQVTHESKFSLRDSYLRVSKSDLVKENNFSLYVDGRAYLPTSSLANDTKMIMAPAAKQALNYDFEGTGVSGGLIAFEQFFVFSGPEDTLMVDGTSMTRNNMYLALVPYLGYEITDSLSLGAAYTFESLNKRGHTLREDGLNQYAEVALAWEATSWLKLEPGVLYDTNPNKKDEDATPVLDRVKLYSYLTLNLQQLLL